MDFKNIEKKYRPIPFWSWNEKLNTDETIRQIDVMEKAGLGGYFMHARGGLQTRYMGDEWFRNVTASIEEGERRTMQAWAYDENGWPSGFGDGAVSSMGLDYQQKFLRFESGEKTNDRTITYKDGYHFYYDVNPFYVDLLDSKVTKAFIEKIYEPYYDRYKDSFCGFFTDEPQIGNSENHIPWSFILPAEYKNEYGEELLDRLIELFRPVGDYENTRLKFWRLVTKLFSTNYTKQIYDWCTERNLGFTGHLNCEDVLMQQLPSNGACMAHYEYFTMPGIDWLGRRIWDCLTPLQAASVAHQMGKKEILSESFALCGHNAGFDELKAISQWQMVQGVTKLCPHLQGYSLRGLRKRDYPPAMYYQQPWWERYSIFNEAVARMGKILSEGEISCDTLLIHNMSSAWMCWDAGENAGVRELNDALIKDCKTLWQKHVLFHLGDETVMERHAYVEGNTLVIGKQRYTTVVIPNNKGFFPSTQRLLSEFEHGGGIIVTANEVPENDICDSPLITYTKREFDGFCVHYFINNNDESVSASFRRGSRVLDITTGEQHDFYGSYDFAPYDSLVLIDDGTPFPKKGFNMQPKALELGGMWNITECTPNVLTLDKCDVYFDDELVSVKENAADVLYLAFERKEAMRVRTEFAFNVNFVPEECFLVCESAQSFDIKVNGKKLEKEDKGYFADISFRKFSLENMLVEGENIISLEADFSPSDEEYANMESAFNSKIERNKLTFDFEFEPIYIIGDFSVKTAGEFEKLPEKAVRYKGDFAIDKPVSRVWLSNLEEQGFAFFAGKITVEKTFELADENHAIIFSKKGINAVSIRVNGVQLGDVLWAPFVCDISSALKAGTNTVELTLVNNLRNMLGPHHLDKGIDDRGVQRYDYDGESCYIRPSKFYKRPNLWNSGKPVAWNEDYCFVEFGIENI